MDSGDTICALSTPPGTGAIAVIRLSGSDAFRLCGQFFRPARKDLLLQNAESHTIHFGHFGDGLHILDEVLVSIFRSPHSYTGEDVVEISVHGSRYIQENVLRLLVSSGARLARPGEFTLRAFLNGKFDLSQAEAVADLIAASSQTSHDLALAQMRGGFSEKIRGLRQKLVEVTALLELELDFSEEDVEFASRSGLQDLLGELEAESVRLIESFSLGNIIKEGIPVAIAGRPNTGKSTLLNALLNEERALVSEIPGTTRDAIEDTIVIGGYSFRFIDTAGLRETRDRVESMGIERTREKLRDAAVIIYVFDASTESWQDVSAAIEELQQSEGLTGKKFLLAGNKADLLTELPRGFRDFVDHETVFVSAKRKENLHLVTESLLSTVREADLRDGAILSNSRHLEALQRALESIRAVRDGIASGLSPDLFTVDIHTALHHLGSITGEITTEEILGNIFSRFCIGK